MKDAEPAQEIYIEGLPISLGYKDEDDQPITSLVMQKIDPEKTASFVENMRDKRIKKDIIAYVERCFESQLNVSESSRGNYLPQLLAKRLSGRKGGNWNKDQIEQTMYKMLDNEQLILVNGHNKSRGKTIQVNPEFQPETSEQVN
jgi:exonuclease I